MRLQTRWSELPFVTDDLSGTPLPAGVTELMLWLKALPTPLDRVGNRTGNALIGPALRARIQEEELMARIYGAAKALVTRGGWRGGPTRAELEEFEHQERGQAAHLRELCTAQGIPLSELQSPPGLFQSALRTVFAMVEAPRASLQKCLQAMALAELAETGSWSTLIAHLEEAGLDAQCSRLVAIQKLEAQQRAVLCGWLKHVQ